MYNYGPNLTLPQGHSRETAASVYQRGSSTAAPKNIGNRRYTNTIETSHTKSSGVSYDRLPMDEPIHYGNLNTILNMEYGSVNSCCFESCSGFLAWLSMSKLSALVDITVTTMSGHCEKLWFSDPLIFNRTTDVLGIILKSTPHLSRKVIISRLINKDTSGDCLFRAVSLVLVPKSIQSE